MEEKRKIYVDFIRKMPKKYKFGLAASSVAGQTMQLVGSEDALTVSLSN